MIQREITPAPGQAIDVNTVSLSPHVVVYRLWFKPAGGEYGDAFHTGDTDDNVPDTARVAAMPTGSAVGYFLAITGRRAATPYRAVVTFLSGGTILPGGTCLHEGTTDSNGYAEAWGEVKSV